MWRLIGAVIVLLIYLIFILLNQDSRSDVSVGFYSFVNVNTYIVTAVAFLLGALTANIFFLTGRLIKRGREKALIRAEKQALKNANAQASGHSAAALPEQTVFADMDDSAGVPPAV